MTLRLLLAGTLAFPSAALAIPQLVAPDPPPVAEGTNIVVELLLTEPAPADCEFSWQLTPVTGQPPIVAHRTNGDLDPYPEVTGGGVSVRGNRVGIVSFPAGSTSVQLKFKTTQDQFSEPVEKLRLKVLDAVNLTPPPNGGPVLTLNDDDDHTRRYYSRASRAVDQTFFSLPVPAMGPPYYEAYAVSAIRPGAPASSGTPAKKVFSRILDDSASTSILTYPKRAVSVAITDLNGDGEPDAGGLVLDGPASLAGFSSHSSPQAGPVDITRTAFTGVTSPGSVAFGDVDGDGQPELIAGGGAGGRPTVAIMNTNTLSTPVGGDPEFHTRWQAFSDSYIDGVNVAAADLDGDDIAEIITAPAGGAPPEVRWWKITSAGPVQAGSFLAYDPTWPLGVSVGAGDTNGDGRNEIICLPAQTREALLVVRDPRLNDTLRVSTLPNPWAAGAQTPFKPFWVAGFAAKPGLPQDQIIYGTPEQTRLMALPDNTTITLHPETADIHPNSGTFVPLEPRRVAEPAPALPVIGEAQAGPQFVSWSITGMTTGQSYDLQVSTDLVHWRRERTYTPVASDPPALFTSLLNRGPKLFFRIMPITPAAPLNQPAS